MDNIKMCDVDKLAELAQIHKVKVELWITDEDGKIESVTVRPWKVKQEDD